MRQPTSHSWTRPVIAVAVAKLPPLSAMFTKSRTADVSLFLTDSRMMNSHHVEFFDRGYHATCILPCFGKKLRLFAYQRVWSLFSQDNRDVSRMLLSYLSLFLSPFVIPFPSLFVLTCFTFRFKGNLLRDNDDIPCNLP